MSRASKIIENLNLLQEGIKASPKQYYVKKADHGGDYYIFNKRSGGKIWAICKSQKEADEKRDEMNGK